MVQLGVGGKGDVLFLYGGVDVDVVKFAGLGGAAFLGYFQCFDQEGFGFIAYPLTPFDQ